MIHHQKIVHQYVICSTRNKKIINNNTVIIVFTNDIDPSYLSGIKKIIVNQGYIFLHGDYELEKIVKYSIWNHYNNNYFIFAITKAIQEIATLQLRMDRSYCQKCDHFSIILKLISEKLKIKRKKL